MSHYNLFTHLRNAGCLTLLVLVSSACGTVQLGQDFDLPGFESRVEISVTTQDSIRNWLGSPDGTGVVVNADGSRFEKWIYYYGHGKLPSMTSASLKYLEIEFNQEGKVHRYNWSE